MDDPWDVANSPTTKACLCRNGINDKAVQDVIEQYYSHETYDLFKNNCADFAQKAWNAGTGMNLQYAGPGELEQGILQLQNVR